MDTIELLRQQMITAAAWSSLAAVDGWPSPFEKEQNLHKVSQGDLDRAVYRAYMHGVPSETIHNTLRCFQYRPLVDGIIAIESLEP